ncbi:MAG TPA: hypothetical protein VJ617_12165 [Arthrobacter sp.]|nr:hypothetical protein [Arthrobacter sp.]
MSIDPQRVEKALRSIIKDIDYDLYKDLDYEDDEADEQAFPRLTRLFLRWYGDE